MPNTDTIKNPQPMPSRAFSCILAVLLITGSAFRLAGQSQSPAKPEGSQPKIKWMSFTDAYNLNKKKPKLIFVDVYTDWCGWCKKMDATTFQHPEIVKYMNDHFYCVKLNAEMKDTVVIDGVTFTNPNPSGRATHQLAVDLLRGRMSYPSYVVLNDKSQLVNIIPGYRQAKEFEPVIHYYGEGAYKETSLDEFGKTFKGKVE